MLGRDRRTTRLVCYGLLFGLSQNAAYGKNAAPKEVVSASAAFDRDDCAAATAIAKPFAEDKSKTKISPQNMAILMHILAICAARADKFSEAYPFALKGTAIPGSSTMLWRVRWAWELKFDDPRPALETLEAMSRGRWDALADMPSTFVSMLLRKLSKPDKAEWRNRALSVLASPKFQPTDKFFPTDWYDLEYAQILYDRGETAAAKQLVGGLAEPFPLIEASLDKRFQSWFGPNVDVRRLAEDRLRYGILVAKERPNSLEAINFAAAYFRILGRPNEALAFLEAARPANDDFSTFVDSDQKLNWYWNSLASTHKALGNYDDAVAYFKRGAAFGENGELNVSQTINLAALQVFFGRAKEAQKTLQNFESSARRVSPYGAMEMRVARSCANALQGNLAKAKEDVEFGKAHALDHPSALFDMQLCVGNIGEAAEVLIAQLEDPIRRQRTLRMLSDFDDPPVAMPLDPTKARLAAVKSRPDVQAAIKKAGGIRRFNVQQSD